jgi:hypothetical protein
LRFFAYSLRLIPVKRKERREYAKRRKEEAYFKKESTCSLN